jgi:hypothetical protein
MQYATESALFEHMKVHEEKKSLWMADKMNKNWTGGL